MLFRKVSVGGEQGRQVREGAGLEGGCHRDREGNEVEERVGAWAGEDLEAAFDLEDLSHGRVGGRDDPAFGIAVSGFPAAELGHDDVLDAGGVDREGEAPGDVLDQILIGVELELVLARGIPGGADTRGGIHPEYRARA